MKSLLKIFTISLLLFVILDFVFGKKINQILEEQDVFITLDGSLNRNIQNEKKFRVKNNIFSHSLKENYQGISYFGNMKDNFCTNKF